MEINELLKGILDGLRACGQQFYAHLDVSKTTKSDRAFENLVTRTVKDWVAKHDNRFDGQAMFVAAKVYIAARDTFFNWNKQFMEATQKLPETNKRLMTEKGNPQVLGPSEGFVGDIRMSQFKAMALDLDYTEEVMMCDMHYRGLCQQGARDNKWTPDRPQYELFMKFCYWQIHKIATWTHVYANIRFLGKKSAYWPLMQPAFQAAVENLDKDHDMRTRLEAAFPGWNTMAVETLGVADVKLV
jgi:hypothetical protein